MPILQIAALGFAFVLIYMTVLWIASLTIKDSSIVDIFWGLGFMCLSWIYFLLTPEGLLTRKLLVVILVTIWGARLSIHIARRNIGRGEDFRYQKFRQDAGPSYWWKSLFQVFLLQGFLLWLIASPLLVVQISPIPLHLTGFDVVGTMVWLIGFLLEAVGDWQLTRFKTKPANKGKVLNTGLWRYTRHPNYFGDALVWWGYFLIALAVPLGFVTVFSPIIMTILLVRVSGVALLEKTLIGSKPGYREYIESTSAFIPWFPRRRRD